MPVFTLGEQEEMLFRSIHDDFLGRRVGERTSEEERFPFSHTIVLCRLKQALFAAWKNTKSVIFFLAYFLFPQSKKITSRFKSVLASRNYTIMIYVPLAHNFWFPSLCLFVCLFVLSFILYFQELMSPNNKIEFENDLTQFFTDNLNNYSNWVVTVSQQSKLEAERRHLQTTNDTTDTTPLIELVPLRVRSFVSFDEEINDDVDALNNLLRETLNRNKTGFMLLLRTSASSIANQVYFARVENVEAVSFEQETDLPSETLVPDEDGTYEPSATLPPESERMSAGAIVGTCIFLFFV
jgi:hypothetical protein